MFSSENNSYPLYYHQSQSFGNAIPESNNILFQHHHHHHHGKYNNYILPPTYPPISENPLFKISSQPSINQESMMISYPFSSTNRVSNARRTAGRKDRHTKIRTAQGVRDRRVRLSMSIAREFFNLQDMLGFDKASKTLGWLLSKSKVAIDELASTTSSSNVVTPPSEGLNGEEQEEEEEDDEVKDLNDGNLSGKKRKTKETNNPRDEILDKEFKRREKARERARERTRNKKIIDQQQQLVESLNHLHRGLMIPNSNSAATPSYNNNAPSYNGFISKGVNNVGESVFLKGNQSISSGSSFDYNYEMISSKDEHESYDSYTDYINKSASESCNYGGILQPPGFEYQLCFEYHQSVHRNSYQC